MPHKHVHKNAQVEPNLEETPQATFNTKRVATSAQVHPNQDENSLAVHDTKTVQDT